ncbi:O-antigen ligase family protein [Patescibacteria group bacterium]|nr:O-antigen ligase family protein [Patescibacteria group bacterium]MCL5409519.1 O-antigen ligase family protein [Patescibacteria group bacterium]
MLLQICTLFLLFGTLFAIWPVGPNSFEPIKTYLVIIISSVSIVFALLKQFASQPTRHLVQSFRPSAKLVPLVPVAILLFILLIHLLRTHFDPLLIWGNPYRPQGSLIYLCFLGLFLVAPQLNLPIKMIVKVAQISLLILFVTTIFTAPDANFRFYGLLGEPNSLAAAALILFPLTVNSTKGFKLKLLSIVTFLLVLMSGSRIAVLAFIFTANVFFLRQHRRLFLGLNLLLGSLLLLAIIQPFFNSNLPYYLNLAGRADIWTNSAQAFLYSPLLGFGFGSLENIIRNQASLNNNILQYQTIDQVHNLLLQWLLMSGVIGTITLLFIIFRVCKNLYITHNWTFLVIIVSLLLIQLFNPVSVAILIWQWWIFGKFYDLKTNQLQTEKLAETMVDSL